MLKLVALADPATVSAAARAAAVELALTHDERRRTRHVAMRPDGSAVAWILPRGTVLEDGTLLQDEDGRLAIVRCAPEPVLHVTADTPLALLRVVYHLANRHVPMQIATDHVRAVPDPVLAQLARTLGAHVSTVTLPFVPEPGAYHHAHGLADGAAGGAAGADGAGHGHGLAPEDAAAGRVGEQLSIAAHARRASGRPS